MRKPLELKIAIENNDLDTLREHCSYPISDLNIKYGRETILQIAERLGNQEAVQIIEDAKRAREGVPAKESAVQDISLVELLRANVLSLGIPFRSENLLSAEGAKGDIAIQFKINGKDGMFVIDKDGVRCPGRRMANNEEIQDVDNMVKEILKEKKEKKEKEENERKAERRNKGLAGTILLLAKELRYENTEQGVRFYLEEDGSLKVHYEDNTYTIKNGKICNDNKDTSMEDLNLEVEQMSYKLSMELHLKTKKETEKARRDWKKEGDRKWEEKFKKAFGSINERYINKEDIEILGLKDDANLREVNRAYKKLALKYHPDKNPNGEENFKKISNAYQRLTEYFEKHPNENISSRQR